MKQASVNEPKTNVSDLNAYRKKRARRSRIIKLSILGVVAAAAIAVIANFDAIVEPLRGIASKIDFKTSNEIGFPIKLPGSATYSFDSFGNNFVLLTDTYLYAFQTDGGQIYALRHGYTNPVEYTNEKRVLLYDKNYYSFSLYNKTSQLYEVTTDDKIVYGCLGGYDMAAIVTGSSKYSNVVYVYDGSGKWKYSRKFSDENVMQVAFSADQKFIYITTIGASGGDLYTGIYKFDISSDGDAVWQTRIRKNSISCAVHAVGDRVVAVFDNSCVSVDASTGETVGSYDFNGTLLYTDTSETATAITYADETTNKSVLVLLDNDCALIGTKTINPAINEFVINGNQCYLLEKSSINCYNADMEQISSVDLRDEYSDFIIIGKSVFLLGYDVVDMETM